MTSKEIEVRSGIPRANIRYYEAEGLLHPIREKNGYRDYSDGDLAALEKIRLLRRLGLSIEELKALQSGEEGLPALLERRMAALGGERGTLERVEQVCRQLRQSGQTFETLDAGTYLAALDAPALPPAGEGVWWKAPPAPPLPESDALPVYTGLTRRLAARLLDEWGMMFLLVGGVALAGHSPGLASALGLQAAVQVIWLFLEPLLLCLFAATPGKALLGLRVAGRDGRKLTYAQGFTRHLLLLWHGRGLFIPIWSWVQMFRTAHRCWNDEPQPWDVDTAYEAAPFRPLRHVGGPALAAVLVLAAAEAANSYSQLPPNRGDLTVAEFAENYNRQAAYMGLNVRYRLDEAGRWEKVPDPPGTAVVDITGRWAREDFQYTVENGVVRAVTLERSAENTEDWVGIPAETVITAATALFWGQEDAPFWTFGRRPLITALVDADWGEDFTVHRDGVTVTARVELRNFYVNQDMGLAIPTEKTDNGFLFRCTVALDS